MFRILLFIGLPSQLLSPFVSKCVVLQCGLFVNGIVMYKITTLASLPATHGGGLNLKKMER
jgi:hypothetical protein